MTPVVVVVERGTTSSERRARSAPAAAATGAVRDLKRKRRDPSMRIRVRARVVVVVVVIVVTVCSSGGGSERSRRRGEGRRRGSAAAAAPAAGSLLREELLPERRRRDESRQLWSEWSRRDRLSRSVVLVLGPVLIRRSGGCRPARIERKEIEIGPDVVRGRCLGSRTRGLLTSRRRLLLLLGLWLWLWRRRIRVPRKQVRPERVRVDRGRRCRRRLPLLLLLRRLGLGRLKHLLERVEPVLAVLLALLTMLMLVVVVLVLVVLMPLLMQVPFRRPRILRLKRRHRRQDMSRIASKHRDAAPSLSSSAPLSDARAIRNREVLMPVPMWLLLLRSGIGQRRRHHHHRSSRSHHHHLLSRRNAHHAHLSPPHPQRSQTPQRYIILILGIVALFAISTLRERQSERRPIDEDLFVRAEAENPLRGSRPRLRSGSRERTVFFAALFVLIWFGIGIGRRRNHSRRRFREPDRFAAVTSADGATRCRRVSRRKSRTSSASRRERRRRRGGRGSRSGNSRGRQEGRSSRCTRGRTVR